MYRENIKNAYTYGIQDMKSYWLDSKVCESF